MKVYGPNGEIYEGDSVDCWEHIRQKGYTKAPPQAPAETVDAQPAPPVEDTTLHVKGKR